MYGILVCKVGMVCSDYVRMVMKSCEYPSRKIWTDCTVDNFFFENSRGILY